MITINFFKKFISKMLLSGIILRIVCSVSCINVSCMKRVNPAVYGKLAPLEQNETFLAKKSLAERIRKEEFYIYILNKYKINSILEVLNELIHRLKLLSKELNTQIDSCNVAKNELAVKEKEYEKALYRFKPISNELTAVINQIEVASKKYNDISSDIKKLNEDFEKLNLEYSKVILDCSDKDLRSGATYMKSDDVFKRISALRNQIDIQTKSRSKLSDEIVDLHSKKRKLNESHFSSMESVHNALQNFERARNNFNACDEKLELAKKNLDVLSQRIIGAYGDALINPIFNYVNLVVYREYNADEESRASHKYDLETINKISSSLVSKLEFILYVFRSGVNSKEEYND